MSNPETTKTSSNHPVNPSFDPMAAFAATQQAAQKMMDDYAQLETQLMARAKQAIETWAQLAQDALAYSAQLSAQARKLGLDAARKIGA